MSNPIKAVIFDVGGVLLRTHDWSGRRSWEARLGLESGGAEEIVFHSEMGQRAQRGQMSEDELWSWIGTHLDLADELESFRADFWRGDRIDETLIQYIRSLRPRYQTAIISNAADGLGPALTNTHMITDAFDLIVISADEGMMKPEPAIYLRTLARLGREPEETVFIDDAPTNVAGARDVGMNAVHFTPEVDLPRLLREEYGVEAG